MSPTPTIAAAPPQPQPAQPAPPRFESVFFSGLARGVYPTDLHSQCSGAQAFHLLVLNSLVVGSNGAGSVTVPTSYTGRGFCVIVYSSPSLSAVLTTRRV